MKNISYKNIPDPDILIRTGNHTRLSNFLLWQLAYLNFFIKKLWPDFNIKDYRKIINKFKKLKKFWKYLMKSEFQKRLISSILLILFVFY